MKTRRMLLGVVIVVCALGLLLWIPALVCGVADSQSGGTTAVYAQQGTDPSGSDSNPVGPAEVVIPEQYQPGLDARGSAAAASSVATVYFTPQDQNTSTTVLFLYNTSGVAAEVGLTAYGNTGSVQINTTVLVPAGHLVRICADTVDTISGSWQDAILVNFRDHSAYAKMTLPAGVKAEGYVAWNGESPYDPLDSMQTLPLRFSTDPAAVFLPLIERE